jgi:hypothetical protein
VVGVNGDLIEQYLSRLRADLRTPAERTAQILAEAEDHLRESVAAGIAIGGAGVAGSVLVSAGYAAAMAVTLARQGRDGGTAEQEVRYAG